MIRFRLFWRVVSYFLLLLAFLTVMTVVTMGVLKQIEKSFGVATLNLQRVQRIDRLRKYFSEMPRAATAYLFTGELEAKRAYESGRKDFDLDLEAAKTILDDSSDVQNLRQIQSSFYSWVARIGDRMIVLADSGQRSQNREQQIRDLFVLERSTHTIDNSLELLEAMYRTDVGILPANIESSIRRVQDIGMTIVFANVLLAVFAIILGVVLTRAIARPVEVLREGTRALMSGTFQPIYMARRDEFGDLAVDFNKMSVMLHNNYTRLTAYSELMTTLNRFESLAEVETKSLEILCTHTRSAVGAMYLLNPATSVLTLASGFALHRPTPTQEFRLGQGIPGQCALLKQTIEVPNLDRGSDFMIETGLVQLVPPHVVASPVTFQENVIGVVVLGSTEEFSEIRREILRDSLPQIGVAITNAMNNEETAKLSREVATKNQELNGKNSELQKAYRVKSDFLSNMSHELRTPLNSIIGFTSVLLGPHGESLTADQRKAMEKVLRNGKHLLQLINDILDFSKIESGRTSLTIDTDDIRNIIGAAMVSVEPMVNAKGVRLIQDVEENIPQLSTDVLKVKQILLNLLSNAAKFTEQGAITVTARKSGDSLVEVCVRDSGIGIEKKNLDKVFEEFQQIDSGSARKYKGTGLGLPIARSYARLLGGDLTVQSEPGKGSTFTLMLPPALPKELTSLVETSAAEKPHAPAVAPPAPPSPAAPAGRPGPLVLSIDDESEVIELLQRYLEPEGYVVRGVLNGDDGMKLAEELHPAVITLDVMMPRKNGWQVLRELKSNPKTKDIPVVMHSIVDNKPLAISLGAFDVVAKPSEPERILDIVSRAVRSKDRHILIVDDNEDFASGVQLILRQEGYQAKVANSGGEAFRSLSDGIPAIIFLDLSMPGMDGFEVVRRLRQNDEWKDIPVVILSGKELTPDERNALNQHIQDFVEKGHFSREAIASTLKRIVPLPAA